MLLRSLGAMEEGERRRVEDGKKGEGLGEGTVKTLASLLGKEEGAGSVAPRAEGEAGATSEGEGQLAVLLE